MTIPTIDDVTALSAFALVVVRSWRGVIERLKGRCIALLLHSTNQTTDLRLCNAYGAWFVREQMQCGSQGEHKLL